MTVSVCVCHTLFALVYIADASLPVRHCPLLCAQLLGDAIHGDVRVPNTLEMQRGPAPLPTHSRQHSRRVSLPVDAAEADVGAPNASARQLRTRSAM